VGDFGALMTGALEARLFDDTGFVDALQRLTTDLEADLEARLERLTADIDLEAEQGAADNPCTVEIADLSSIGALADLGRDVARSGTAAGAGAATGAVTAKLLAKQTAGAVTAKLAGKKSFQAAATLAAKAAAKKGGSAVASALGGTAVCAPSGPWAVLCGIGAGVAAWLAVDKAMIEIDEVRFREEMRTDLLEAIAEQQAVLTAALKDRQRVVIDADLSVLAQRLEKWFVPLRDGL
jgi:hypothetical protein